MKRATRVKPRTAHAARVSRNHFLLRAADPFHIPDFLRIPQAQRNKSWDEYWKANPPRPAMALSSADPTLDAERLAFQQKLRDDARDKENARLRALKNKTRTPKDLTGLIWSTRFSKWIPDPLIGIKVTAKPTPGLSDEGSDDAPSVVAAKPKDDLGQKVSDHCGTDAAKLKKFATANGVWDDKYAKLPNFGLQRMNVCNRLRNKVKKGHKVKW